MVYNKIAIYIIIIICSIIIINFCKNDKIKKSVFFVDAIISGFVIIKNKNTKYFGGYNKKIQLIPTY